MKEYVRIDKETLKELYKQNQEKNAYIQKLEKALQSVERQLANIKETMNAKT
jgi:septation ring formation regulator EzrA